MTYSFEGSLLIVDDREDVRRAMSRYFGLHFETVHLAASPPDVERILRQFQPVYWLCDYWLGHEYLPSTEYIPGWKKLVPNLKRVALMTGTKVTALGRTDCVDAVFQKPLEPAEVLSFFADGAPFDFGDSRDSTL
jgi:DNA-binding NtrC family response regulator